MSMAVCWVTELNMTVTEQQWQRLKSFFKREFKVVL